MIKALRGFVENIENGGGFWFEDRDKAPNGDTLFLEDVFVCVGKKTKKDKNGRVCELLDAKFVPLRVGRTQAINLLTGEIIKLDRKGARFKLLTSPKELAGYTKTKEFEIMDFLKFFGEYGDYCKKAFPKTDFAKMINFKEGLNGGPDVTVCDIVKLMPKVEKTYLETEQKRLSKPPVKETTKTAKANKKSTRGL